MGGHSKGKGIALTCPSNASSQIDGHICNILLFSLFNVLEINNVCFEIFIIIIANFQKRGF